jgi:PAS domain S-box-containing protein
MIEEQVKQAIAPILVIDDDPMVQKLLDDFLNFHGYGVATVGNGPDALHWLEHNQCDLALVDLRLPQMEGMELIRQAKRLYPHMQFIVISGLGDLDDAIKAMDEGVYAYVKKPFTRMEELQQLVVRSLDRVRLERENEQYQTELESINRELERRVKERTQAVSKYQRALSYLFKVSSEIGSYQDIDSMLQFICWSIVNAGLYNRTLITVAIDSDRITNVGFASAKGDYEALKDEVLSIQGAPLLTEAFQQSEFMIGNAIYIPYNRRKESSALIQVLVEDNGGSSSGSDGWHPKDLLFFPFRHQNGEVFGYLSVDEPPNGELPSLEVTQIIDLFIHHAARYIEQWGLQEKLKVYSSNLERMVEERSRELRQSEAKFTRLVKTTSDIVYVEDLEQGITDLNQAFYTVLKYPPEDYIGKPLRAIFEELATDSPLNERARKYLQTPIRVPRKTLIVVELRSAEDRKVQLEINETAIRDKGKIIGIQGIARDITERRELEHQLIKAERFAATGTLAAAIAHEVNNPLQALFTNLNIIRRQLGDNVPQLASLELMNAALDRIKTTVRQLLELHRPSTREKTAFLVNKTLEDLLDLMEKDLSKSKIQVQRQLSPKVQSVYGSPQELHQVYLNLILNAQAAMPEGGTLTVSTRLRGRGVEISVADTGVGIDQEILPHIFEPFYTSRKGKGTGLGLYIVDLIIQNHQGKITVKSEVGKGSSFTIWLPLDW